MKAHYEKYEPTIAALKRKYEGATREKSLASIERDRLATALKSLQAQLSEQETKADDTIKGVLPCSSRHRSIGSFISPGPFVRHLGGGAGGTAWMWVAWV